MRRINLRGILAGLVWLLVYSVAGTVSGLAIWYFAAQYLELWRYDPAWVSSGFLATLMLAGYLVPEVIERFWGWFGPPARKGAGELWTKSLRLLIHAIFLPVAVFVAVNQVPWIGAPLLPAPSDEYNLVTRLGDAVLASSSSGARVAGIEALGAIRSNDSLAQLTRLAEEQPEILNDRAVYTALSTVLTGYGPQAKRWLLSRVPAQPPASGTAVRLDENVFARYFQPAFLELQAEITRTVTEPARQTDLLQALAVEEARLKANLAGLDLPPQVPESQDRTVDFVLDTLAGMEPANDAEISQLGRQVAGTVAYPAGTRRRGLLVVAQFGTSKDYDFLLPFLEDSDESLRATALGALKTVYQRSHAVSADANQK